MSIALHYNYRKIDLTKLSGEDEQDEICPENVSEVYMKECELPLVPFWIYSLRNLTILKLTGNKIDEISDEIAMLINLEMVDLSDNKLKTINRNFFKLTTLKCLDFSGNLIEEIPTEIGNLTQLEVLLFDRNSIREVSDTLLNCEKIFQLSFEYCFNLSKIPGNLLIMRNLKFISLRGCNLSYLPSKISPNIQFCLLTENRLVNHIPLSVRQHVFGIPASDFYKIPMEQMQHFYFIQTETIRFTRRTPYIEIGSGRIANVPPTLITNKILNRQSKEVTSLRELSLRAVNRNHQQIGDSYIAGVPHIFHNQLKMSSASCLCGIELFQEAFILLFYQKDMTPTTGLLFSQFFCGKTCLGNFLETYKDSIDIVF